MGSGLGKLLAPLERQHDLKKRTDYLLSHGFIQQESSGVFDLLPLSTRIIQKINNIIRSELNAAGCVELELSNLVDPKLWIQSNRLRKDTEAEFIFTEKRKYMLAPTAEEQITNLMRNVSYKQLPLSFYQITRKFRNELRPRNGMLRTREFLMKDLYTFDLNEELAEQSYKRISEAYEKIYRRIGIPFLVADADSGDMGGTLSHEYHALHEVGEDKLVVCSNCTYTSNWESAIVKKDGQKYQTKDLNFAETDFSSLECHSCSSPVHAKSTIEIGHTFMLGTKYTEPMQAVVNSPAGNGIPLEMGCYGIGVSRLISALAEVHMDNSGIKWPVPVAPFSCAVVSKNSSDSKKVADMLVSNGIDAYYEDRTTQIGYGIRDAKEKGIPFTIVLGSRWSEQKVDILPRWASKVEDQTVSIDDLVKTIKGLSHL